MSGLSSTTARIGLVLLALVAGALRLVEATRVPSPWLMPDEFLYAELGRSLYGDRSLKVLGHGAPFYSFVHPLVVGAPLTYGDGLGYAAAKALQVAVMTSSAFVVYAWARALVAPAWALLAAALTLAVPGFAYAGLLTTEATFYAAFVLAAWTAARAIARPTPAAQVLALAAMALAAATRLHALVLVPAFATAVFLAAALERRPRLVRDLAPCVLVSFAALAAWLVAGSIRHGSLSGGLGGYAAAAETGYSPGEATRFVAYHAADVLLFTGLIPVCAVAALAVAVLRGGRFGVELNAYLAVTVSLVTWMTLTVGVFASRHVGHLAERNLFHVAPLLFVGLVAWLALGAPRTPLATFAIATSSLLLLVYLPVERFTWLGALHNEPSLVPLYELIARFPEVDLDLLVPSAALALAGAFSLASGRVLVVLAVLLVPSGALAAGVASSFVVDEARALDTVTFDGPARTWVDEIATGPVAYVYGDARFYPAVLQTVFWNRRVEAVYELPGEHVPGLPRSVLRGVSVSASGRLRGLAGERYVLAPNMVTFVGTELDRRGGLTLTRVGRQARVARVLEDVHADGTIAGRATLRVFACRGGTLQIDLHADAARAIVVVRRNGVFDRRVRIRRGGRLQLEVELKPPARTAVGSGICSVGLDVEEAVRTARVRFRAPRRG